MKKAIVLIGFADKDNFAKRYNVGDELPGSFTEERIANLVSRGIVSYEQPPLDDIDLTQNYQNVVAQVKAFADVEKLQGYLEAEQANEKPRASVVKAIEERIAKLEITE